MWRYFAREDLAKFRARRSGEISRAKMWRYFAREDVAIFRARRSGEVSRAKSREVYSGLLKHREVNLFLKIVCIVDVQADLERVSVPPASQGIICSATQQSQR
jgi:hypothetical protein